MHNFHWTAILDALGTDARRATIRVQLDAVRAIGVLLRREEGIIRWRVTYITEEGNKGDMDIRQGASPRDRLSSDIDGAIAELKVMESGSG